MYITKLCFIVDNERKKMISGTPFMFNKKLISRLTGTLATLLILAASISTAVAEQVTLSYVDAQTGAQTLTVDANSSTADLALAAALLGENGVGVLHDPSTGSGTLADIAGAMASAAPLYAARVARTLAVLSPDQTDAIVAAVNAVPGVNTKAVSAAVHFGPSGTNVGPQSIGSDSSISLDLNQIEPVPSKN